MSEFIIVWRNSHREPHISKNSHDFKETYFSFEEAKEAAELIQIAENSGSEKNIWYFDFQIYEEVNS